MVLDNQGRHFNFFIIGENVFADHLKALLGHINHYVYLILMYLH